MGYCSASDVAAYCQNLLGTNDNFTESSCPTLTEIDQFITSGCGVIETVLLAYNISVPIASGTAIFDWLTDLNAYYATARAQKSRENATVSPGERTRGMQFESDFWNGLNRITQLDITLAGAGNVATAPIYVGGISKDDKLDVMDDSDWVEPRFRRGQFHVPGVSQSDRHDLSDEDDIGR